VPLAQPDSICKVRKNNFLSCKTSSVLFGERLASLCKEREVIFSLNVMR
jgi:hypothetical protein